MWSTRRQRMWYSSVCTSVETICLLYWHVSLLLLHTTVLTHPEWGHLTSQWCNNVIFIPTVKNHEKIQVMSHSQKNLVYKAAKFLQQVLWWFRECPDLSSKIEIASGLDNHKAVQKMKKDPIWQKKYPRNLESIWQGRKKVPPMESINGMLHLQLQLFNDKLTGVTGKRCCDIWQSKLDVVKWNWIFVSITLLLQVSWLSAWNNGCPLFLV